MSRNARGLETECGCTEPELEPDHAPFDRDIYDCVNCGHMIGTHDGLDGECSRLRETQHKLFDDMLPASDRIAGLR